MSVSLDGYVEGPNREIDWHLVDDEFNAYAADTLAATDALLMGRVTYELMAGYWPTARGDDPAVTRLMNDTPKLVFSRTLREVPWRNSRLALGSIADEVAALRRDPADGLLWVGGSTLATSLIEQDLPDELRIIVTPVLLGARKPVFGGIRTRRSLRLLATRPFHSGAVLLTYVPRAG
jgi:dihydrofolate reductase